MDKEKEKQEWLSGIMMDATRFGAAIGSWMDTKQLWQNFAHKNPPYYDNQRITKLLQGAYYNRDDVLPQIQLQGRKNICRV